MHHLPLQASTLERLLDRSDDPVSALALLLHHLEPLLDGKRPSFDDLDLSRLQHLVADLLSRSPLPTLPEPSDEPLSLLEHLPTHADRVRHLLLHPAAYARPATLEGLLDRAHALRWTASSDALAFAELALLAASLLPGDARPERRRYTVRGRLLQAKVHRLAGQFPHAQAALDRVRPVVCDQDELQRLYHLYAASLARDRRRFAEALRHLDRAEEFTHAHDSPSALARLFAQRSYVLSAVSRLSEAHHLLVQARPHLDPDSSDPCERDLALCVAHNDALLLLDLGAPAQATERYHAAPELYQGELPPDRHLRHEWLLGRLAHQRGDAGAGCRHLHHARELALGIGQLYSASLVDLDLAYVHLDMGLRRDAAAAARRGVDVLGMLDLPDSAIRPLLDLADGLAAPQPLDPRPLTSLLAALRHATVPSQPQHRPS
ncbi:MAG: hypothetical protein ACOC92_02260 [bacterium]